MKNRILLACAVACIVSSAHAADFSAVLKDPYGTPMPSCQEKTEECAKPLTLGRAAAFALLASPVADTSDPRMRSVAAGDDPVLREKISNSVLAFKIINAKGDVDLSAEEIVEAKKAIGKVYPSLIVYRALELLEPKSVAGK